MLSSQKIYKMYQPWLGNGVPLATTDVAVDVVPLVSCCCLQNVRLQQHAITTIKTMTTIKLPTVIVTDAVIPNEKNLVRKLSSAIRNIELKYKYIVFTFNNKMLKVMLYIIK